MGHVCECRVKLEDFQPLLARFLNWNPHLLECFREVFAIILKLGMNGSKLDC